MRSISESVGQIVTSHNVVQYLMPVTCLSNIINYHRLLGYSATNSEFITEWWWYVYHHQTADVVLISPHSLSQLSEASVQCLCLIGAQLRLPPVSVEIILPWFYIEEPNFKFVYLAPRFMRTIQKSHQPSCIVSP